MFDPTQNAKNLKELSRLAKTIMEDNQNAVEKIIDAHPEANHLKHAMNRIKAESKIAIQSGDTSKLKELEAELKRQNH